MTDTFHILDLVLAHSSIGRGAQILSDYVTIVACHLDRPGQPVGNAREADPSYIEPPCPHRTQSYAFQSPFLLPHASPPPSATYSRGVPVVPVRSCPHCLYAANAHDALVA